MEKETVTLLMETVEEALRLAADSQLKLVALDQVLREQQPPLHAAYLEKIESLRKHEAYAMNLPKLDKLRAKLLRE